MATTGAEKIILEQPAGTARTAVIPGLWWKALCGVWMAATIVATLLMVGPAVGFPYPAGARIIIFHVPCAELAGANYIVAAAYAIGVLLRMRRKGWAAAEITDMKCATAMELGLLFSILTTVTGSIFSRDQWGSYWSWDPRQTSILVILLIYAAYLVLRGAVEDPETRGRLASVYALVAVVPGMFLIWVLPRIVYTLHGDANNAVVGNQLGGGYRRVMYLCALPAFLLVYKWLFDVRMRIFKLMARREQVSDLAATPRAVTQSK